MPKYNTRYQNLISKLTANINLIFNGPWKKRSVGLISILLGYYLGSNILTYFINNQFEKQLILLASLLLIETVIRVRTYLIRSSKSPIFLNSIDNMRLGVTYAIVLEAFKLGS
tara:strand:- start:175 stop:513 length:339 start_codon:yes stop_codon:yes gene_type:complete